MTLQKMLKTAVAASALLVALALPAVAQAKGQAWTLEGKRLPVGESNGVWFEGTGDLSISAAGVVSGPCEVQTVGKAWNTQNRAKGSLYEVNLAGPCLTNLPSCEVAEVQTNANGESSWPIEISGTNEVELGNVGLIFTYEEICEEMYGVPLTQTVNGSIQKAKYTGGCIEFTKVGPLTSSFGSAATGTGSFCIETSKGKLGLEALSPSGDSWRVNGKEVEDASVKGGGEMNFYVSSGSYWINCSSVTWQGEIENGEVPAGRINSLSAPSCYVHGGMVSPACYATLSSEGPIEFVGDGEGTFSQSVTLPLYVKNSGCSFTGTKINGTMSADWSNAQHAFNYESGGLNLVPGWPYPKSSVSVNGALDMEGQSGEAVTLE
jgi:hypothetical protein